MCAGSGGRSSATTLEATIAAGTKASNQMNPRWFIKSTTMNIDLTCDLKSLATNSVAHKRILRSSPPVVLHYRLGTRVFAGATFAHPLSEETRRRISITAPTWIEGP
jgi:hypothetical protein